MDALTRILESQMPPMSAIERDANGSLKFTMISGYTFSLLKEALRFKIKPRWDREEEYLLAKKEVELGSSCTNINQVLHSHFPSRSLEAIKSHRKDLNYRETVQRLAAETALRLTDSGAGSGGVCPRVMRTRELREGAPGSEGGASVTACPVDPVLLHRGALQSSPVPQSQLDFVAQGARPRRPLRSCRRDRLQPSVEVVLPESSGTSELPDPPFPGDDLGDVVTPGGVVTHVVQQPQRSRSPSESPPRILRGPSSPLRDQSQASSEERIFTKLVNITTKQEIDNATLRAQLAEREKIPTFAEVVRATPAAVAGPPPGAPGATVAGAPGGGAAAAAGDGSGSALLIYLKEPTPTSANDIRVMIKKYFEPQRLGLKEVAMREIRNGIAVQSQCLESLQRLADAIQEHPTTKDAFVLSQPSKRKPQFRVTGVDPDILPAELLTALRAQNPDAQLEATEYHHRTSYKEKSGNCTHIFDVNADGFKKLEGKTRLALSNAGPFQREDEETSKQTRRLWLPGRGPHSHLEAATIIIREARDFVEQCLGARVTWGGTGLHEASQAHPSRTIVPSAGNSELHRIHSEMVENY
ncbi:uncharacterized protein ISCGN_001425 [Ixodes scapularis]